MLLQKLAMAAVVAAAAAVKSGEVWSAVGGGDVDGRCCRGGSSLVPRPFYACGARWERDKGLVPVFRACVKFYWNPGKIVFFDIF